MEIKMGDKIYTLDYNPTSTITFQPNDVSGSIDVINDLCLRLDDLNCQIYATKEDSINLVDNINTRLIDLENQNKELRKMVLSLTTLVLTKIGNDQLKNN
jgi:hypothetical protein